METRLARVVNWDPWDVPRNWVILFGTSPDAPHSQRSRIWQKRIVPTGLGYAYDDDDYGDWDLSYEPI